MNATFYSVPHENARRRWPIAKGSTLKALQGGRLAFHGSRWIPQTESGAFQSFESKIMHIGALIG
jgi:hypothetical protein